MKKHLLRVVAGFSLLCVFVGSSGASVIGDPAFGISVERWIKGSPVSIRPGTNVFVLEFWATWCPPCRESIPHLTELHRKYAARGLVVLGISDEPPDRVSKFVGEQGDGMAYRVGVDTSHRTFKTWMDSYGGVGIPHAFIIDRAGKVAWHGFPTKLDEPLEAVMDGTYNLTAARHLEMGNRLRGQYENLINSGRDRQKAAVLGEKMITDYALDWRVPHRLARLILTDPDLRFRDYKLALQATTKATSMTPSWDALDMHARALYANGRACDALEAQKKAMTSCKDPAYLSDMEKRKAVYEKLVAQKPGKAP